MSIREEFRLKNFIFSDIATERFCVFQWRSPGLLYVTYRLFMAVYTLVWLVLTAKAYSVPNDLDMQVWSAYLTNWTYTLLTIYFIVHALVTLVIYLLCRGAGLRLIHRQCPEDHKMLFHEIRHTSSDYQEIYDDHDLSVAVVEHSTSIPWYMAIIWILFNAVSVGAIMVTLVFWAILVPGTNFGVINNENLQLHLVNTILVLIEHFVTAVPVRLLHVVYPIIYGLIYVLFSLFYWVDDHSHVMYFILDWGKPGETIGFIILIGVVIIPVIHLCIFGIYKLKMFLFKKLYRD